MYSLSPVSAWEQHLFIANETKRKEVRINLCCVVYSITRLSLLPKKQSQV